MGKAGNDDMGTKATQALADVHPQMLRAKSEGDRKKFAVDEKALIGRAVERAISVAGLTKQEAAFQMGYSDSGTLSRWCAGTETPQFAKLWAVEALRGPLVIALAEAMDDSGVIVTTHVQIRQRKAG